MKYCYLHLGLHKTGSSSIQYTLYKSRGQLKKINLCYPVFHNQGQTFINHSLPLSLIFNKGYKNQQSFIRSGLCFDKSVELFSREFNRLMASNQNIILSGEDISNFNERSLTDLQDKLHQSGFEIKVICFVREPFSLLPSEVQQRVKSGFRIRKIINQFAKAPSPLLAKVLRINTVFKEVLWVDFDRAILHQDGPAGFFLEALNIAVPKLKSFKKNVSSSMEAIRLIDGINRLPLLHQKKRNYTRSFREINPIKRLRGQPFYLTQEEISPVYASLIELRAEFESACAIEFSKPIKPLAAFAESPFTWQETSLQALLPILPKLSQAMLYRLYDYFYRLYQKGELSNPLLEEIGQAIEKALKPRFIFAKLLATLRNTS